MKSFEVLMVSVEWERQNQIKAVTPAKRFLEPSNVNAQKYEYDIVIYTKEDEKYQQFAIKTKNTPYLNNSPLYNIGDDLWIIKGEWQVGQRKIGYHFCPSINTIGKIEIQIYDDLENEQEIIIIDVNSNIEDFDFNKLKEDFDGELWNLITSNKKTVQTDRKEMQYGDKVFRFPENQIIIEFLKEFDKIADNPKRELKQTVETRKAEKVIPTAETYRKISKSGITKFLPSKGQAENFDIYENRIVCSMLYTINQIVAKNAKYSDMQVERLKKEIYNIEATIEKLKNPPIISKEQIESDIEKQDKFVNTLLTPWKEIYDKLPKDEYMECKSYTIKIISKNEDNSFFCKKDNYEPVLIRFMYDFIVDKLTKDHTYVIDANLEAQEVVESRFQAYKAFIKKIRSQKYLDEWSELKRLKDTKKQLENNHWERILDDRDKEKDKKDRKAQSQTLLKRKERIISQINNLDGYVQEQNDLLPFITKRVLSDFYKKITINKSHTYKPSMTFIQNVNYRNTRKYYDEILKSEGIEMEVFDLYENVVLYGIREMPQVYELWCLIAQIKVLEDSFHFKHHSKDLVKLLKSVNPAKTQIAEHIEINFDNNLAGRTVKLHYQKNIAEDKRPDFILEIKGQNGKTVNLVLDSKFKNYNYKKSIIYETIAMRDKYNQDGQNPVFVLHPCKDVLLENKKIRYTNFGGERIYYKKEDAETAEFPFHNYGYIELKPNCTDNIKKLFAMAFEYLLETNKNAVHNNMIDPKPENAMFCVNCGETKFSVKQNSYPAWNTPSPRHYYIYNCQNINCKHEIQVNYCWNCKTRLFKHGSYWDYHLESNSDQFDIRCPNCGRTRSI
jgi:hypothetical protein